MDEEHTKLGPGKAPRNDDLKPCAVWLREEAIMKRMMAKEAGEQLDSGAFGLFCINQAIQLEKWADIIDKDGDRAAHSVE